MFRRMAIPEFLRFRPVHLRAQRNGWPPSLQLRFIIALARGAGVGEAARAVGKSRQSAYQRRERPGAESFASAWDRATAFAGTVAATGHSPAPGAIGIDTLLVPRHYRGRLVGFVLLEDVAER